MVTPIIILLILSSPLGIAFCYSSLKSIPLDINKYASWGLGLAFIFFFIGHIAQTDGMVEMLPPWGVALADLNKDGKSDFIIADGNTKLATVYISQGK